LNYMDVRLHRVASCFSPLSVAYNSLMATSFMMHIDDGECK
jgi:hypothetical protein